MVRSPPAPTLSGMLGKIELRWAVFVVVVSLVLFTLGVSLDYLRRGE